MLIQTSRFGPLDIAADKIVTFEQGLMGFPQATRLILLESKEAPQFNWLQSADHPELAWVLTDPKRFVPDYAALVCKRARKLLGFEDLTKGVGDLVNEVQVSVIVNRAGNILTANFAAPLLMSAGTMRGMQTVVPQYAGDVTRRILTVPDAPPPVDGEGEVGEAVEVAAGSAGDPAED